MDLYILLGVEREATLDDIKRAYRRLARRFHPDINPGDRTAEQRFRQIAEAYETLSDPDRRRRYDTAGRSPVSTEPSTFGFEGFDFSVSVAGSSASTFGDLFGEVLHQRHESRGDAPERGADLHHTVSLTFDQAMRGGTHEITVTRQIHCRTCGGLGRLPSMERRCAHCEGSGIVKSARGHMVFSKPCARCGGTGVQGDTRCTVCGGRQVDMRTETVTVNIPAGLEDGTRVRVAGKGHAGPNAGEHGDLFVTVRVAAHPLFRRDGDNLHIVVPVTIHEAALGAKIFIPSLEGQTRVRVPPGTQSGQRFRLRERGVPSARSGQRGDLIVEFRLVLPKVLDERSKELLREFGKINQNDVRSELFLLAHDPMRAGHEGNG
jgi:molecular chaperone DnaJ